MRRPQVNLPCSRTYSNAFIPSILLESAYTQTRFFLAEGRPKNHGVVPDALQDWHNKTEKALSKPDEIQKLYNESRKEFTGVLPASKAEVAELRGEVRTVFAKRNALYQALIDKVNALTPVRQIFDQLLVVSIVQPS